MRFCELKEKEVINCKDCKRLGYASDIEFDLCTGEIKAIIVPSGCRWFGWLDKSNEYYIDFCHIIRIGPDIILVDINDILPKK